MDTAKTILSIPLLIVAGVVLCLAIYVRFGADVFCALVGMDLRIAARSPRVLWTNGRRQ